ncbi:hypothetical protein MMPV_000155 [Pyropia vietnamensis]
MSAAWSPPSRRRSGNDRLAGVGWQPVATAAAGAPLSWAFATPLFGLTSAVVTTAAVTTVHPAAVEGGAWRPMTTAYRVGRRVPPWISAATALVREGAFVGSSLPLAAKRCAGGSRTAGASDVDASAAAATAASDDDTWWRAPPPVVTPGSATWAPRGDAASRPSPPPRGGGVGDRSRGGGFSAEWARAARTTVRRDRDGGVSGPNGGGGSGNHRHDGGGASQNDPSASDGVRYFNTRITAAGRRGDLSAACRVLADLDAALPGGRNVYTLNAMLLACVTARRPDAAAEVWAAFTVPADPATVADVNGSRSRGRDRGRGRGDKSVLRSDGAELFRPPPGHPPVLPSVVSYNTRLKLYFDPPDPAGAAALVATMDGSSPAHPLPDIFTYNMLLATAVAAGDIPRATTAVAALKASGLCGDIVTVTTLATLFGRSGDVNSLDDLLVAFVAGEYGQLTVMGIATIADAYSRAGRPGAAVALLSRLDKDGALASVHVVNRGGLGTPSRVAVESDDGSCDGGQPSVVDGGDALLPSGVPPTLPLTPNRFTYNVWLKALRQAPTGTITAGLDVVSRMKRAGSVPDHATLLTLAGLCGRREGAASAAGVLDAAVAKDTGHDKWVGNSVPLPAVWKPGTGLGRAASATAERAPAMPAFQSWEAASCRVSAAAGRAFSRVSDTPIFYARVPHGAKASIRTFNVVIRAYLARSPPDIPSAIAIYTRAVALSTTGGLAWYAPDAITYTLLVDGAARAAEASPRGGEAAAAALAVAEAVIADMEARVGAVIAAAAAAERDPGAAIQEVLVHPVLPAYNALIKAHRHRGDDLDVTALAEVILSRLATFGMSPTVITFNSLLDLAATTYTGPASVKGLAVAVKLVRETMPASGVSPDLCTYNTLIKACGRAGVGAVRFMGSADASGDADDDDDSSDGIGGRGISSRTTTTALAIAHDALHRLTLDGLTPDDYTYHGMMCAAAAASDATRALHYFRLAERERLVALRVARGEDPNAPDRRDRETRARDARATAPHTSSYVAVMRALNRESYAILRDRARDRSADIDRGGGGSGGGGGGGGGSSGVAPLQPPVSFAGALFLSVPESPAGDAARGAPAVFRLRDEMLSRGVYVSRATHAAVAVAAAGVGDVATTEAALGAVLTAEARTAAVAEARRRGVREPRGGGPDTAAAAGAATVGSGGKATPSPSSAFMRETLLGVAVDPPACLEDRARSDLDGRLADEAGVAADATSTLSPTTAAVVAVAAAAAAAATDEAIPSGSVPSRPLWGPTGRDKVTAGDPAAAAADGGWKLRDMPLSARLDAYLSAVHVVTRLRAYLSAPDGGIPAAERVLAATIAARRDNAATTTATAASAKTDDDASGADTTDAGVAVVTGGGDGVATAYPPLDAAAFNIVLHAAVRVGDMDATLRVLHSMVAAGVSPTAATATATRGVMQRLAATVGALDGRVRRVLAAAAVAAVAKAREADDGEEEEIW